MMKYLKYYISTFTLFIAIIICSLGNSYYPTIFFTIFSLLVVLGDIFLGEDDSIQKYTYPRLLNLPIYMNLPLLLILVFTTIFIFSNHSNTWLIHLFNSYLHIDLLQIKNSATLLDQFSFLAMTSLFIGTMGTVPGHELTHRKKNTFDMFIGNWLLALSWDGTFAIEHVYGHHKNVGLSSDPATAKRGENIYAFILRAIKNEHRDGWLIEFDRMKRRGLKPFGYQNKMIIGYLRSLSITIGAFFIGGLVGMLFYLLCAFIAKSLLEAINYSEHYGLVREPGKPVYPKHSWNSNHVMSSIYLYNVTRHSAHHERTNLKYWELGAYPDAPMMPQGYLSMLFLAILLPFVYHKIMAKKLIVWDEIHATPAEVKIAMAQIN